jgi:hypothetical protein
MPICQIENGTGTVRRLWVAEDKAALNWGRSNTTQSTLYASTAALRAPLEQHGCGVLATACSEKTTTGERRQRLGVGTDTQVKSETAVSRQRRCSTVVFEPVRAV